MPTSRRSRISDEQLLAAVRTARNLHHLLHDLGLAPRGANYEVVRRRLRQLGVEDPRFAARPRVADPSPEQLLRVVASSFSYAEVCRALGWKPGGGTHRRVKALIAAAGCDTSHFLGRADSRGLRRGGRPAAPLEEVLVAGALRSTGRLKARLVEEGLLFPECSSCERTEWQGAAIPLELDHVNGDRTDNRLENLRLLCPNCHAQTPTYRGRNIGGSRSVSPHVARTTPRDAARRRLARVVARTGAP